MTCLRKKWQKKKIGKKYIDEFDTTKAIEKEDVIARWKIDFIFKHVKNNRLEQNEMGIVELNKFYKRIYESILNEKEKKTINLLV